MNADISPTQIVESIGMIKILDESLQEIETLLNRMEEIALQSAAGSGAKCQELDRDKLQEEMEYLKSEIDRIADRIGCKV